MTPKEMIGAAAVAAVSALLPSAALAQAERKCEMYAYTIDEDPKGINVRGAPSNQAPVVHVIKKGDTMVSIVAEQNGWFRIKEYARFDDSKDAKVNGWLHGSRLAATLMITQAGKASERLLEEPSERSKTLLLLAWSGDDKNELAAELPGGKREVIDYEKIKGAADAKLLACTNGYAKVRVHKYEGWLPIARLCGSPVTTCN